MRPTLHRTTLQHVFMQYGRSLLLVLTVVSYAVTFFRIAFSYLITSAEEGGYVFGSVCLSVCLSVGLLANL